MFNKEIFGPLGDELIADPEGLVPEPGDHQAAFSFPLSFEDPEWDKIIQTNFETLKRLEATP